MYKWYQALVQDLNENVDESLAWLTQKTEDVIELNCKVVKKVAPPSPTFLHKPLLSTPFLAKNFVPSPSQVTQFLEGPRVVGVGVQLCKPTVPCSALLSNNYVIIKACGRNIKGSTNLPYSKKVNLTVHQTFLSRPSFVSWQRKVRKMRLLWDRMLFYPTSLNICCLEVNYITTVY